MGNVDTVLLIFRTLQYLRFLRFLLREFYMNFHSI